MALGKLVQGIMTIDAKVFSLSHEVIRLASLLKSVERTIRECQAASLAMAYLDEDLWQQIDTALADCGRTLDALDGITIKIRGDHGNPETTALGRLMARPGMHMRFLIRGEEVSDLTRKIYKSSCSIQTALAVINVYVGGRDWCLPS